MSNHVGVVSRLVNYVIPCWTGQQTCCRVYHNMLDWSADLIVSIPDLCTFTYFVVAYVIPCWTGQLTCCRLFHTMLDWLADLLQIIAYHVGLVSRLNCIDS